MHGIAAVARKELRQIVRDRRTLLILLLVPAFFDPSGGPYGREGGRWGERERRPSKPNAAAERPGNESDQQRHSRHIIATRVVRRSYWPPP